MTPLLQTSNIAIGKNFREVLPSMDIWKGSKYLWHEWEDLVLLRTYLIFMRIYSDSSLIVFRKRLSKVWEGGVVSSHLQFWSVVTQKDPTHDPLRCSQS